MGYKEQGRVTVLNDVPQVTHDLGTATANKLCFVPNLLSEK